jgi:hypothetical protein
MKDLTHRPLRGLLPLLLGTALLGTLGSARAQSFNVGSSGELGDVVIEANTTVDLPPDGKLHYKSLTVKSGARMRFRRNVQNTPVFILSQGDVVVESGAVIDVNGSGALANDGGAPGPGGFGGGKPGFGTTPAGFGYGPGGGAGGFNNCNGFPGHAGGGGFGSRRGDSVAGATYGNTFLIPLIGGSGGGGTEGSPGGGGGGGGGAVLVAANTRVAAFGQIQASGGGSTGCLNDGSGGAIRLVALKVEGNAVLETRSGNAGLGRIRVDTLDRSGVAFNFQGVTTVGGNLFAYPEVIPRLDTIEVAGNLVPEGSAPTTFLLPFGSPADRKVKIQARDFGRVVPIRVTLTPDTGERVFFDAEIDNLAANPATVEVDVKFPVNAKVTVHCWTK